MNEAFYIQRVWVHPEWGYHEGYWDYQGKRFKTVEEARQARFLGVDYRVQIVQVLECRVVLTSGGESVAT